MGAAIEIVGLGIDPAARRGYVESAGARPGELAAPTTNIDRERSHEQGCRFGIRACRGARVRLDDGADLQNIEDKLVGKPGPEQVAAAREEVRDAAQAALSALYAIQPGARRDIERAAGYAAFSTFGMKLMIAGGTSGKGVAVDHRTGARTYMKMVQVQGGLGFGVSKNQVVFVFTTAKALADFINQGWEFGGQANVSAVAGGQGGMFTGAAALSPGVYVYQITETGLNAELTVAGTRFFVDPDLN